MSERSDSNEVVISKIHCTWELKEKHSGKGHTDQVDSPVRVLTWKRAGERRDGDERSELD